MKNLPLPALSIAMLLAVSCKKNGLEQELLPPSIQESTKTSGTAAWKSTGPWQSGSFDQTTLFTSTLEDSSINSVIAQKGLVLVYLNNNEVIHSLPFEENKGTRTLSWYYQVTEGGVRISFEAEGADSTPEGSRFTYFILSEEQLNDLDAKGYSKEQLMHFSYEAAAALLKR